MPENRLSRFGLTETGEKVTYLHRTIGQETDKLGKALVAAIESPGDLLTRNAELERQMQQMIEDAAERERIEATSTSSHAERAALKQLAEAQAESEAKDSEVRKMRIALEAARDELQKLQSQKNDLRRDLEAERSELHKCRQELRTTRLPPHLRHDLPRHGSPRASGGSCGFRIPAAT